MMLLKLAVEGVTLGDDVKMNGVRRVELHSMERFLRVGQLKIHFTGYIINTASILNPSGSSRLPPFPPRFFLFLTHTGFLVLAKLAGLASPL